MPVFACSRPFDEICKRKQEVGEDENSKKVLGAANASRANKSRPVSRFVRRVAAISLYSLVFILVAGFVICGSVFP